MYKDMIDTIGFVKNADPELGEAMDRELEPSAPEHLELIASAKTLFPPR